MSASAHTRAGTHHRAAIAAVLLLASVAYVRDVDAAAASGINVAPPCTHDNKQIALYLDYSYRAGESLAEVPATDISVGHFWNATAAMRKFGSNGVYAANPIGFKDGPSGYFGSQSDGDPSQGGLLFSIWDSERPHPGGKQAMCSDPDAAPNATWCKHKHSFPLSDSCDRHCLDCGLPSKHGWKNTTGTQCGVHMTLSEGDHIVFRLRQTAVNTSLHNPIGLGQTYKGSEWTLTATNASDGHVWMVGKMFFEDSYSGLTRFGAFHEHIGCTPCASFYESEIRVGPYDIQPGGRSVASIGFSRKNVSCELYSVSNASTVDGHPAAQISTGPGTGPPDQSAL